MDSYSLLPDQSIKLEPTYETDHVHSSAREMAIEDEVSDMIDSNLSVRIKTELPEVEEEHSDQVKQTLNCSQNAASLPMQEHPQTEKMVTGNLGTNYEMNLEKLSALTAEKEWSIRFLQEHGILPSSRRCSKNHLMILSLKEDRWRCRRAGCRQNIALKAETWMEHSHLSYRQVILFVYCWSRELTSLSFCDSELGMSHATTVVWSGYLREVCAHKLIMSPALIGGPNTVVEIDVSMFTRRTNQVGRVLPEQWVFGGICRETGECFLFCVADRTAETLLPIIRTCVRPGTTVVSDQWSAFEGVGSIPRLTHITVNNSENFVDPVSGAHTQCIENLWRTAKERNRRQNGTQRHLLESYMCEFMWRKRTKCVGLDPFKAILADIALFCPPQQ